MSTEEFQGFEEQHPLWETDRVELTSVGIDIGSSTCHLIFSVLEMRRLGASLSSRFVVVRRQILHKSDILLTPYEGEKIIHAAKLSSFVKDAYGRAGLKPKEIDTGALIVTGEAVRKENARAIAELFAEEAGKFVCASAGPNLEAILAAHGSGAVSRSRRDPGRTVLNIDVGGGTSKFALVRDGTVQQTAAINAGARLVSWDSSGRIHRLEDAGRRWAEEAGLALEPGALLTSADRLCMADLMAGALLEITRGTPLSPLAQELMITPPLPGLGKIDTILFSGGVSEYLYGLSSTEYGDLGPVLADAIRERFGSASLLPRVAEPAEKIRATVIGASQYTVQLSGNTIYVSDSKLLPLKNVPVIRPLLSVADVDPHSIARGIGAALRRLDLEEGDGPVALALGWEDEPSYSRIRAASQGILSGFRPRIEQGVPLILVFDRDLGKLLGIHLKEEHHLPVEIVSIDGIELREFDFVDIGSEIPSVGAVPVVIKSLVFPDHHAAPHAPGQGRASPVHL
ncbi:MAG: ethanolamine ammonia-lyase reactivating factor EutA [Acidobacteria bacterium]|nr:ethanolamine ammonia-lyase reactivating factor EutA [Acidobacteriota bacterium]